ncbi:MAG: hypothetical protein IK151_02425 [Erysipelotrichaceae bacterium]|nr:hypothetical protein [Erysipelotrichaceae bacterium]
MKILKTIFGFLSSIFVLGGAGVFAWQYFRNKQLFVVLLNNSIVKGSLGVLQKMGLALIAIIIGLILFAIYMKIGGVVRRIEREKRAALKEQQRENEAVQRQLREEAENAKAEIEQVKKENELMKMTFMRKKEEEPETEGTAEQE